MDTSRRRFTRLAIATATAAGVALVSPVVAVADESEVLEAAPTGENSDQPVVAVLTTEPLVIELFVEGEPPTDSTEPPDGAEPEEPAETQAMPTAKESEPVAGPSPMVAALDTSSADGHTDSTGGTGDDHTGDDHTGGPGGEHTGGSGTGDPYLMTFEVSWQLPDGAAIPVLEVPTAWRMMFDLAAASATGGQKPKPTSARCTYPDGSTDLVCEFENPGKHSSVTDGMIVPAKRTATYTVTVHWPISGWTIEGANADSYSARDLDSCPPRGGGGHDSGHDEGHESGHDETVEVAALEETGSVCIHTVVMRQPAATPEPPPVEPPATEPPASEVPAAAPPQSQTPAPPEATPTPPEATPTPPEATPAAPAVEVLPVTVTPRALPATGNTATTTLMIATIILAVGGCLFVLARRRTDLPLT